jgi:hypothetical protein
VFLISNNASTTLLNPLTNSATVLVIQVADANKFPQPNADTDYFMLTLEDTTQNPILREIVKCIARTANNFTIVRAQEGSVASSFGSGVTVSNRITAGTISALYGVTGYASQLYLGAFASAPTETNSDQSLFAGLLYYNTTTNALYEYDNGWNLLTAGSGSLSQGQYLGASAVAPSTRPDGSAIQGGDLYYNTTAPGQLYEYTDGAWVPITAAATVLGATTVDGNLTVDGNITSTGTITAQELDANTGTVMTWDVTETLTVGSSDTPGQIYYNGLLVIDAGDLSGTELTQNWPNGNAEMWGESQTGDDGTIFIAFTTPFPNGISNLQLTVISPGNGVPAVNGAIGYNKSAAGFSVLTYNLGGPNGPVAFDWVAKGY